MSKRIRFILASTSPRRRDLLQQVGVRFRLLAPNTEEIEIRGESARRMVARLCMEKAQAAARRLGTASRVALTGQRPGSHPKTQIDTLILAADTTVVAPDGKTILNKPRSPADARRMLRMILGRTHTVLTGYCILGLSRGQVVRKHSRVVRTRVKMRDLGPGGPDRYLVSGESSDKAGAYAAQGFGSGLIAEIKGSYTNVVGLPVAQVLEDIETCFGVSWEALT